MKDEFLVDIKELSKIYKVYSSLGQCFISLLFKSVLPQILVRIKKQTAGEVRVIGQIVILLEFGSEFDPENTGSHNNLYECCYYGA